MCPRYNNYPAGLGKGFDSGVVGAWLDAELAQVLPASLATGLKGLVDQLLSFDMGLFCNPYQNKCLSYLVLPCCTKKNNGCFWGGHDVCPGPSFPRSCRGLDLDISCMQPLLADHLCIWIVAEPQHCPTNSLWRMGFYSFLPKQKNGSLLLFQLLPLLENHIETQDGYSTLASLTAKMGYRWYKIRPKLHMMCHIQLLGEHAIWKNSWSLVSFF